MRIVTEDTNLEMSNSELEEITVASDEAVLEVSEKLITQNKEAYEELAK